MHVISVRPRTLGYMEKIEQDATYVSSYPVQRMFDALMMC